MTTEHGVGRWCVFVVLALAASSHLLYRSVELYAEPGGYAGWGFGAALSSALLGLVAGTLLDPVVGTPRTRLPWWIVASAAGSVAAAAAPFFFFDRGSAERFATVGSVAFGALFVALAARDAAVGVFRPALALGTVERLLHPARLLALGLAFFIVFATEARVGHLRAGLATAGALVAAGAVYSRIFWFFEGRRLPGATSMLLVASGVAALVGSGFVVAGRRVPANLVVRYPDDVVYARESDAHDYVVTAGPGGFELYRDAQLVVSALDERRYAAALARPILGASKNPARVLLLFGGTGTIERDVLEDPRVRELTVVAPDELTLRLARGMPWLRERGNGSLSSRRVRAIAAEPMTWLRKSAGGYDAVIANLPAPTGYCEGKYYTRYFFDLLAARLADGGAFAVPAASAFASPEAFASIRATVAVAVPHAAVYHADVPSLGVMSFIVGSFGALPEPMATPGVPFDAGRDLSREPSIASTLSDQRVVGAFRDREPARR